MITLDPDFVGGLAPQPSLDAPAAPEVPYSRLLRLAKLHVSGKADTTEGGDGDEDMVSDQDGQDASGKKKTTKEEKEKKKMRGRNKALKRYLRKQRKNVIDPKAVALRQKLAKEREARKKAQDEANGISAKLKYQPSVLDRFIRPS